MKTKTDQYRTNGQEGQMGQLQGGQLGQTAKGRKGDTNLHGGYLAIAPFSP